MIFNIFKTAAMNKKQLVSIKGCFLFALSLLLILNALPIKGFSQNQIIYPDFEEIYIHTDKSIYSPGENLWFKAYILDDEYHLPSGKSNLLYLNIIDFDGNHIISEKFPIQNGFSNGDVLLSRILKKGKYQIVAYTENMKNESPTIWYKSEIIIDQNPINLWEINYYPELNKLSESILAGEVYCLSSSGFPITGAKIQFTVKSAGKKIYSETQKTDSLGIANINWDIPDQYKNKDLILNANANYRDKKKNLKINIPLSKDGINLEFFPESGSLVQGLLNEVAFKVNDQYGNPINIKGTLINNEGVHIKNIETLHEGMGLFSFVPNPNETYFVKLKQPDLGDSAYELPEILKSGYVLSIKQSEKSIITFDINMTPDLKGKKVSLSISNGLKYENIFESVLKDTKRFSFLTSSLPVGIANLTLFSEDLPVAERLIFLNKHKRLQLSIETDKEIYDPKEKVEMLIKAVDFEGNPTSANLSLAVLEKSKLANTNQDIASYLLLGSKLEAATGDLSYYLKDTEAADSALNILLITQGWRKIERIEEYSKIIVNSENTPGIRGTVYTKKNKPTINAQVQIINTNTWQVISTETNDLGRFFIPIEEYLSIASNQDLSISAALPNKTKNLTIVLDPDINKAILSKFKLSENLVLAYNLPEKRSIIKTNLQNKNNNLNELTKNIEKVSVNEKKHNPANKENKKKPTNAYTLEEEELKLLRTIGSSTDPDLGIIGLIRMAGPSFGQTGGKIIYRGGYSSIAGPQRGALIVVNGVPYGDQVANVNWIDPLSIKGLKVSTNPGAALMYRPNYSGLIEITLLEGTENINKQIKATENDVNLSIIKGFKISKQFYSPDYSTNNNKEKSFDSRSTLYWNPNLILDNSGEQKITFFNGDKKTFFQCKVVGINGKGLLGNSSTTLKVK